MSTYGFQNFAVGLHEKATRNIMMMQASQFTNPTTQHVQKKALRVDLGTNRRVHCITIAALMKAIVMKYARVTTQKYYKSG
jgi:hypothetical protein